MTLLIKIHTAKSDSPAEVIMDEYSPKRHDIAELKYLCNSLNRDAILNLQKQIHTGLMI